MAFFKEGTGKSAKVIKVTYAVDVKEWEAAGNEQCDKDGKPLKQEAPKE
jgi:hypothetical protein